MSYNDRYGVKPMNTRQAEYILMIVREGSITSAAKKLNVSQPSLSQMVRNIETNYNIQLFDRTEIPMKLTYAGEKYVECARAVLAAEVNLENQLHDIRQESGGRLRLGISVQRAMLTLPLVLPRFTKQYPNVTLEITEAGSARLEEMLRYNEIDLLVAAIDSTSPRFKYTLIERETIGILAGKDAAIASRFESGTPVAIEEASHETFISLKPGHSLRVIQDQLFRKYGLHPHILLETDSLEVARRVTLASDVCMLCTDVFYDKTAPGVFLPLKDYTNNRHFYACSRKDEVLPRYAEEFIDAVRTALKGKDHNEY